MRTLPDKRILLADDHPHSLEALRLSLTYMPGIVICGEAGDGIELIEMCTRLAPDVVITDLKMPGMPGLEAISILQTVHPDVKVLAWTQYMDNELFQKAVKAGARGYLYKSARLEEISMAINTVLRGYNYYCEHTNNMIAQMVVQGAFENPVKPLPPDFFAAREREVLVLICQEYATSEIARMLSLSPNTVNKYRANLKFKIGTDRFAGLLTFAMEYGILKPEDIKRKNLLRGNVK
ncbi:response regulator [Niabella sp. CJ426]|uniref:response regulator n=1 Tax=Niabella sp. CJ426 TaxID=3393740 RepID=UPI003D0364B1